MTDLVAIPLLRSFSNLLMLLVPLITMRTIAGERRAQSLALLLAGGVGNARIVIGKYFGAFGFVDRADPHSSRRCRSRSRSARRSTSAGSRRGCSWTRPVRRRADRDRRALLGVDCAAGARRRGGVRDHEPACDRRRRRAPARASTTPASIISRCRRMSSRFSAGSFRASTSSISSRRRRRACVRRHAASIACAASPTDARSLLTRDVSARSCSIAAVLVAFLSTRFGFERDFSHANGASLSPASVALLKTLDAPVEVVSYASTQGGLRAIIADFVDRYRRAKPDVASALRRSRRRSSRRCAPPASASMASSTSNTKDRSERLKVLERNRVLERAAAPVAHARAHRRVPRRRRRAPAARQGEHRSRQFVGRAHRSRTARRSVAAREHGQGAGERRSRRRRESARRAAAGGCARARRLRRSRRQSARG